MKKKTLKSSLRNVVQPNVLFPRLENQVLSVVLSMILNGFDLYDITQEYAADFVQFVYGR